MLLGICSEHGYVAKEAIRDNLPSDAQCDGCLESLEKVTTADEEEVEDMEDVTTEFKDE